MNGLELLKAIRADQNLKPIPVFLVTAEALKENVVEAVKAGKFSVYAVATIDEGIEILTGVPAGKRDEAGKYPEGSVNERVEQKLRQFTEQQKKIAASGADQRNANAPDRTL